MRKFRLAVAPDDFITAAAWDPFCALLIGALRFNHRRERVLVEGKGEGPVCKGDRSLELIMGPIVLVSQLKEAFAEAEGEV
jgi:hypothetical protein